MSWPKDGGSGSYEGIVNLSKEKKSFSKKKMRKQKAPLPNRFIGQHDVALCHDLFHITETEREAKIQPYTVTNNLRREAEPLVERS
jgi:hypothetical protein